MSKHTSEIVRAYVQAGNPVMDLMALGIVGTVTFLVVLVALDASLRWHDVALKLLP